MSIHPSTHPPTQPPIHLSTHSTIHPLNIHPSIHLLSSPALRTTGVLDSTGGARVSCLIHPSLSPAFPSLLHTNQQRAISVHQCV